MTEVHEYRKILPYIMRLWPNECEHSIEGLLRYHTGFSELLGNIWKCGIHAFFYQKVVYKKELLENLDIQYKI